MLWDREAHCNGVQEAAKLLLVLGMLLLATPLADALSLQINAPESVREGDALSISLNALNSSGNVSYEIKRNAAIVSNSSAYTWQTGTNDSGTYVFAFRITDSTGTVEESRVIEVLDSPNEVTILSPAGDVVTDDELKIRAIASSEADSCSYSLEGQTSGNLNMVEGEWVKILLLSQDKVYNLTVQCQTGEENASETKIFILDTKAPAVTSMGPEGSYSGTPVPLKIETNENAFCKYGLQDAPYDEMENEFSETGGTEHRQLVSIGSQGDITYYVSCEDRHGNSMKNSQGLSFFANLKPSAEIRISGGNKKADLLKPGTYDIELTTSEPVIEPVLEYEFSNEQKKRSITLEGQGMQWEGFLAIPEDEKNDIGTFYFSAKDLTGQTGSTITKGKIFLVDSEPPEQVENFELRSKGIDVEIEWFYEGEAVDDFIIYRDIQPEVDYLDKWAETPEKKFVDNGVLLGQRYYYRIAAMDKAGNIGPLSKEKSIVVEYKKNENEQPIAVTLKLNQTQEVLKTKVFDINLAIQRMESEQDLAKLEIIRQLGLLDKARQARHNIETLIKEVDKLKLISLNEEEAGKRIEVFLKNVDSMMDQVADSITVIDSIRRDQVLMEEDIEEMINEVMVGIKMEGEARQIYSQSMKELQDKVSVSLEAITAKIYYQERISPQEVTLIHKKIISPEPVEEAIIVENIPKAVARRSNEVIFKETPIVLRPDPVVKWERKGLKSTDIYYYVNKIANLEDVQEAKTVILEVPRQEKEPAITGNVVQEEQAEPEEGNFGSQLILFLGLLMLGGLSVYYLAYVKEGEARPTHTIVNPPASKSAHPPHILRLAHGLKQAHSHADTLKYEDALSSYKKLLQHVEKAGHSKLDKHTRKLYDKIMLMRTIDNAHYAIDKNNVEELKKALRMINEIYSQLGRETPLAKKARENYSYFQMHLKRMDKEEFFNNLE